MNEHSPQEQELFDAARKLSQPAQRAAFLDAACAGDAALRQRLDELLASQGAADDFFRPLPQLRNGAQPPAMAEPPVDEQAGTMVGRYKLLEKIGEGGFGVVYLAQQKEPVKRRVALKIIKLGMDTKQVVARFEAERQALALLDHPNIAKVFDGGSTDSGRPYFVMELVRGVPITQYCDEHCLSTGERLELFLQVSQAVQHSHQKGIIHRDLKPSNILITVNDGKAVPKVIDFGVAKATQQELTEKTIFTQFHHFIGTPAYMSPEQTALTSLDIDTRSDIYALGVLLYELLTGKTPFDGKELLASGLDEMRRTIRETEPPRPSTRLSTMAAGDQTTAARLRQSEPPKLVHELRGDLDWIVMKCLEKDRNRRYETASSLAMDLQRHLDNEPVVARPPSAAYRFWKFVRRNKLQFAAATFGLVMLIVAVAVSSWQAVRAKRAEEAAQEQAKDAEAIKHFLVRQVLAVSPYVDPEPGPNSRLMVDRVAREVQTEFADRPKIEGELRFALGMAYAGLADSREAVNQFEKAHAIRLKVLGPQHSDTLWALSAIAQMYPLIGRSQEAKQLMTNALGIIRSSPHAWSEGEAEVLWTYGWLVCLEGRPAEGLRYLHEAMVITKQTLDPKDFRFTGKLMALAQYTAQAGQSNEAETLYAEGIRQCEQEFGTEHPTTAQFLKHQTRLFLNLGRAEEARQILERIIPIYHRTLGTNHNNGMDAEGLLAEAYEKLGRIEDSGRIYASLYPRWEKYLPSITARDKCEDIARFFVRHQRYDEAKTVFQGMYDSFEKTPPVNAAEIGMMIAATAEIKGLPAAAGVYRKYLDHIGDAPAICRTVGTALLYTGDIDGYRQVVAKVLARPVTESPWEYNYILNTAVLGTTEFTPDQVSRCEALIQAVERNRATATEDQQNSGCRAIGGILLRLGRLKESLDYLERAEKKFPSGIERARVLVLKSLCLHRLDRTGEARAAFDEAEAIMQPELLDHLPEREGFLDQPECTYLIHRREAMALLGGTQTNQ